MELLGNNPSMQDLIEKLNEVIGSLNNSLPNTDSEIAEVKKLVSFGSGVLAGRLNAKLWYFKTQELMTASTELCEGDSCFVLKDGATTGEGTFEYWYIYKTSDVVDIIDSYVDLSNPDLVAVKLQDMTLKDVKDTLSAQISDQSKDLNTKISNLRTDTETALSGKADLVNGLIPASQLPSYVDDIVESWLEDIEFPENAYAKEDTEMTTPLTPEFSKIYVNLLNNKTYRWGGNFYVEISKSLAIGETATTAFSGNRGVQLEEKIKYLENYVTPQMFGAKCQEGYDDSVAMNSAVAYLAERGGGVLYLPKGTYHLKNHFVVNADNISVIGENTGSTIIKVEEWVDGIRVSDNAYPSTQKVINNILIKDITIDGNRTGYTNGPNDTYGNGINLNSVNNAKVLNCIVKDVAEQSIVETFWENDSENPVNINVIIEGCAIYNPNEGRICIGGEGYFKNASIINNTIYTSSNCEGIVISNNGQGELFDSKVIVSGNHIISTVNSGNGIHIGECMQYCYITDNIIERFDFGIRVSVERGYVNKVIMTNNVIKDFMTAGIMCFPLGSTSLFDCEISANYLESNRMAANGTVIYTVSGVIQNNYINVIGSSNANGIEFDGDGVYCIGNAIRKTNGYAIKCGSASKNAVVCNNIHYSLIENLGTSNIITDNIRYGEAPHAYTRKNVTLGNYGECSLGLSTNDIVVSVYCTKTNCLCVPYVNDGQWMCHVSNVSGQFQTGDVTLVIIYERGKNYFNETST